MSQRVVDQSSILHRRQLSRRDFLTYMWLAAAGLLAAEGGIGTVASLWPRVQAGGFGGKIRAGDVDDFPLGSLTYFKEGRFYISHVEAGLLAFYRKCTHLGCVVPWRPDERSEDNLAPQGRFNCPCHSSIFDRYGLVHAGPAPRPLDIFPITIDGGLVIVDTGTIIQRAGFKESQVAKV
ncbi:MAG: ubiquinol-cytochrome c reductase iron-sulfur subunit [Chloroflexi bacterium]|nr:ubiquinol-cytochrome c reductase iron-sulfur subunit [Chloroflexota bacterium]